MNSIVYHAAMTSVGMIFVVITLCIVSSFFLIVAAIGTAGAVFHALESRWNERHGRFRGARHRARLSSKSRAK
jgi:hypothetical protein